MVYSSIKTPHMQSPFNKYVIYYYAAVNWFTGALHIKMMTGTLGSKEDQAKAEKYQVRHCMHACG